MIVIYGERGVLFLQLEYLFTILFFVLRDRYYIQYFEAKQHDFLIHKTKSQSCNYEANRNLDP